MSWSSGPAYESHVMYADDDGYGGEEVPIEVWEEEAEKIQHSMFEYSQADAMGDVDEEGHLQSEDLFGVKTLIWDVNFSGTLDEFAKLKAKTRVTVTPAEVRGLRHVTRATDRANAGDEHLVGDLDKGIILNARVIEQWNESNAKVGINVNYLVPTVACNGSRYVWTINPKTHGYPQVDISQTTNLFSRWMYKKTAKLTPESLKREVNMEADQEGRHAYVDSQGIIWDHILKTANKHPERYQGYMDELISACDQVAARNDLVSIPVVVPMAIAKDAYETLVKPLEKISESYVDLRKLSARAFRTDGEEWNSLSGISGRAGVIGSDAYLNNHTINRVINVGAKIELKVVLN